MVREMARSSVKEEELLKELDREKLPVHIAIIMDGNGRWARERRLPRIAGHRAGIKSVREIVKACGEWGIKILTLYAFSAENWSRPRREVHMLMNLLKEYLAYETRKLHRKRVKLQVLGQLEGLPEAVQKKLVNAMSLTERNKGLLLNLALNYGGRSEIIDAVRKLATDVRDGKYHPEEIDESLFSSYLYTAGLPDPDLLIRTSGEQRISNFLLWQVSYCELWITDIYWPDFHRMHLLQAILDYQQRERRFGAV